MGVQLRKLTPDLGNRVIHKDFYECGRYVAVGDSARFHGLHGTPPFTRTTDDDWQINR